MRQSNEQTTSASNMAAQTQIKYNKYLSIVNSGITDTHNVSDSDIRQLSQKWTTRRIKLQKSIAETNKILNEFNSLIQLFPNMEKATVAEMEQLSSQDLIDIKMLDAKTQQQMTDIHHHFKIAHNDKDDKHGSAQTNVNAMRNNRNDNADEIMNISSLKQYYRSCNQFIAERKIQEPQESVFSIHSTVAADATTNKHNAPKNNAEYAQWLLNSNNTSILVPKKYNLTNR